MAVAIISLSGKASTEHSCKIKNVNFLEGYNSRPIFFFQVTGFAMGRSTKLLMFLVYTADTLLIGDGNHDFSILLLFWGVGEVVPCGNYLK